ncbi:HoxN/HupN/NixA family nickel/cobalt transporter [Alicyclobacillus sendaiensis]|uniref:Nickel/cobalt efflux system n=1 Tax=Alicyclobacillus sendaiensis PA2 TaxID=3029425 RepID=A0ABT6XUE0_ALISE|nr:HoxN/HupN/NixA family nickel/cobalt transporter [Alicyclobacillus sendaiensis]MDI9258702.1 HoxN/HupN/NixA family nickel/cobalt transporter [Alicyclobacillus sendaiensis PA2]
MALVMLALGAWHHPDLMDLGAVAYTLGMRHAFDADHIAAIDNTVRKLRQEGMDATSVGFFFSMGHSTVVFVMAIATVFAVRAAERSLPTLENIGGYVGTVVSAGFLFMIGIVNLVILLQLVRHWRGRRLSNPSAAEVEQLLQSRGFIYRITRRLFLLVRKSSDIYPIGFLFGLGFDTASEITLLAISAGAAKSALPAVGILSLPLLFASGMSLFDTADGAWMCRAYGVALASPVRRLLYNVLTTGLSVFVALSIGMLEAAQVLTQFAGWTHGFCGWLQNLDLGPIGMTIVGIFVAIFVTSYVFWARIPPSAGHEV